MITPKIIEIKEPKTMLSIPINAFPLSSILCPGSTLKIVLSSGAPKNIEGMLSIKIWVVIIAEIKTTKNSA